MSSKITHVPFRRFAKKNIFSQIFEKTQTANRVKKYFIMLWISVGKTFSMNHKHFPLEEVTVTMQISDIFQNMTLGD